MKKNHYYLFLTLLAFFSTYQARGKTHQIVNGGEYYLYNIYYDRILGQKSDGTTPGISKAGTVGNENSYTFVAESNGTDGYFFLRQKSSGKYLAASSSNTYSVVFQQSKGTSNHYLWSLTPGLKGKISSKQSAQKFLGCDSGKESETYTSVWYDKTLTDLSYWQFFEAKEGFENSRKQFYLEELSSTIEEGEAIAQQMVYSETLRQKVSAAVTTARQVYQNANQTTLKEIIETTEALLETLNECRSSDAMTLLKGNNFDVDNTFTLALNKLAINSLDASVSVVIRNSKGNGAVIDINGRGGISVESSVISAGSDATSGQNHDYQFAFNGTSVQIYRDGTLIGSAPSYIVSAVTSEGTNSEWSILRKSNLLRFYPEVISATKAIAQGTSVIDSYGNKTRYAVFLKDQALTLNEAIDFHIMEETSPLQNTKIDLTHENAWVIFDNTLPSDVVSKYLSSFTVNGENAVIDKNIHIGVYLNGAIVIPIGLEKEPFSGYSEKSYTGNATDLGLGAKALGTASNTFQSFVLKRGYMAVLASGANGSGYSRVYVADHQDIKISTLPDALNKRISSVHIKRWNYVSKKGWCSTTGNSAIATEAKKMRATWFYTWSADRASTRDTEYIPIWQHLYWPSITQISGHTNSTHVLGFNEPEHAEQHTSDMCSCGGVISPWTSCTKTPDLQITGMRIGSPSPTDASWLTEYINHCNDMAYRCDFVVIHSYWGTNEAANATAWYNQLKSIYDKTKRPIWITEWNNGASWTTESWPSNYSDKLEKNRVAIKEILNVLDTCRFIERYSIYNWDSYYRAMISFDGSGWVTPAGEVYRDNKSTFAYNADVQFVPVWWRPSIKTVELKSQINASTGKIVFTVNNGNGDLTDKLIIQRKDSEGNFYDYYTETNRYVFDNTTHTYSFDSKDLDIENDEFRLRVVTLSGEETFSSTITLGYIVNPTIVTSSKTEVDGWICKKSAANGYTKSTGDTYLEVWDTSATDMHFDYYQDIEDIANGVYELTASCFNSSNGIAGASVNGNVGLYAQSGGIEYFAPVTEDGEINVDVKQTIPYLIISNRTLRIGIKNIGPMTARWAGADNFKLRYLGSVREIITEGRDIFIERIREESNNRYKSLFVWNQEKTQADASGVIINPDCNRKDSYGWTTNTVDYSTGEAYDGNTQNNYWNKWASSAFTSEMYQDFKFLPAGDYTFSALLRCSNDTEMEVYVSLDEGKTKESKTFKGTGATAPAGSLYKNGWQKVTTPTISVPAGKTLRIGFTTTMTNKWWSADHFTMEYTPPKESGISDNAPDASYSVYGSKGYLNIVTPSPVKIIVYNLAGSPVLYQQMEEGNVSIPFEPGIYIVNKQKVIVW